MIPGGLPGWVNGPGFEGKVPMQSRNVIIIGAGIGGLAAGHWLAKKGYEVEILEASARPGGRMVTLEYRGDRVDVGAQFYHSNFRCALEFLDALNLNGTRRNVAGKIHYTLGDGSTYLYNSRLPYMKLLGLRGNLQLYRFVLRHIFLGPRFPDFEITRDFPAYDNQTILDLFSSPADRRMKDYLVKVITMGEALALPEWVSLAHYIRLFRMTLFQSFFGLTRGISMLAEEMAGQLPVQYESPVEKLIVENGRVAGVQMAEDGSVRRAGHVIVAVTPPAAARMMPEEFTEERSFLDSVVYSPLPMPVFFLDRPLRRDVSFYFNDPGLDRTFVFAIDAHAKVPEMCPSGKSALTGWAVYPTTLSLMDLDDEKILKKALEDMELMIPGLSGWIEHATVHRHSFVNAIYPPGAYRSVMDFQERAKDLKGVSFVSSVLRGMSMEAAMRSGADAVRRVCGEGGMV
jgi:protoporphyrinogen/coproporphyrinogen III oxidase